MIPSTFNDNTQTIRRTDEGLVNLTDLWKAAGSPANKAPNDWLRPATAARPSGPGVEFVEFAQENTAGCRVYETKRGRSGGTFADRRLAIAYAHPGPEALTILCKNMRHFDFRL